tara:strand:+ start:1722 stop:1895 length:174 start_codon:yes stop_codon:yes gene_type:complete
MEENKTKHMPPITYLKKMLNDEGDFLQEYKRLSESDRLELKEWAKEEMAAAGIAGTE